MENLINLIGWIIFGLIVHTFVIVPFLMELALAKPKKTPEGRLRVKVDGFVIKWIYKFNFETRLCYMEIPQNLCQLYRGLWLGLFLTILTATFYLTIGSVVFGISLFFGFAINTHRKHMCFHSYQYYGEHEEKTFVAPWTYCVPLALLIFVVFDFTQGIGYCKSITSGLSSLFSSLYFIYALLAVFVFVLAIMLIVAIRRTKPWVAFREFLKAKKSRLCPMVEPVYKKIKSTENINH